MDGKTRKLIMDTLLSLTIISYLFVLLIIFKNIITISPTQVNILLILPTIFLLVPYLTMMLYDVKSIEAKMEVVPRFLRDIVDSVESGTDLISSIKNTRKNQYGILNEDIRKFVNQLSWGIDFEVAILNFAENIRSKTLKRDLRLVVEARKIGGHVEKILRELSQKIQIENLRKKERKSNLASNTFTGYISFLIFVFIIILIYNSLFVGLTAASQEAAGGGQASLVNSTASVELYLTLFTLLAYELAILSGFLFGLMQENNLIAGAPHVVMLIVITFIGFFFFI